MTALESRGATEVAPLVFVTQLLVPALLAPVLVHEPWDSTPLGGLVLVGGLLVVAAGSALLASSRVVAAFTAGAPRLKRLRPPKAVARGRRNRPATERATAPRAG